MATAIQTYLNAGRLNILRRMVSTITITCNQRTHTAGSRKSQTAGVYHAVTYKAHSTQNNNVHQMLLSLTERLIESE